MAGLLFYLLSMSPQIWHNYKRKSVDGLSPSLFILWIVGDACNLLGTLLTSQVTTSQYTGMYFVITDAICVLQLIWYRYIRRTSKPYDIQEEEDEETASLLQNDDEKEPCNAHTSVVSGKRTSLAVSSSLAFLACLCAPSVMALTSKALHTMQAPPCLLQPDLSPTLVTVGSVLSWLSGSCYFFSRIPQIWVNYRLKSVEGLSVMLFVLTVSANISYGVSMLLRFPDPAKFFSSTLPYLIGSMGTLVFDGIIIYQTRIYG
jgi:uncharacterized protein with PQ loop repeat